MPDSKLKIALTVKPSSMNEDFITRFLPGEFIQALYWTLLHSLWQGLILVVLSGIAIQLTKKTRAVVRYNILTTLFFAFFFVSCLTFIYSYERIGGPAGNFTPPVIENIAGGIDNGNVNGSQGSFISGIIAAINQYSYIIITVWLAFVFIRCFQLIISVARLERMRSVHTFPISAFWDARIQELSRKMNITSRVTLRLSKMVNVPCVVGFFKPTILIPFSLLSGLTQQQIEAILIHELAHIRRRDFYVNILQGVVGVIYFFNPALIWVSAQIRKERENCCDDIVLQGTSDKATFIKALVSFQEYNMRIPNYAPALAGRKRPLLARIERMITNTNKTLSSMEKLTLVSIICILSLSLLSFSRSAADNKPVANNKLVNNKPVEVPMINNDTFPKPGNLQKGQSVLVMDKNGKDYKIIRINGKVTEFYIDGKRIPESEVKQHTPLIKQLIADHEAIKVPEPPIPPPPGSGAQDNAGNTSNNTKLPNDDVASEPEQIKENIIADLVSDGIIADRKSLVSVRLTMKDLTVNKKVQSAELHQKFSKKYIRFAPENSSGERMFDFVYTSGN